MSAYEPAFMGGWGQSTQLQVSCNKMDGFGGKWKLLSTASHHGPWTSLQSAYKQRKTVHDDIRAARGENSDLRKLRKCRKETC